MSQSLETKLMSILFKIQGYSIRNINIDKVKNRIVIDLDDISKTKSSSCLYYHERYDSNIQEILIGVSFGMPVYGRIKVYRHKCDYCGILTERQTISEGKQRYSKSMSLEVLRYTELMDNQSASKLLGIPSRTIYRIDFNGLSKLCEEYEKDMSAPSILSVDEVAYKRGHNYATILTGYTESKVLWISKGRKSVDLKRAYKKFGKSLKNCEVVTLDFWKAYETATRKAIPKAKLVYDRFHLSRILNRKIEEERREYQNELDEEDRKHIKKNCRWIILKRRSNLSEDNLLDLENIKAKNEPLYEMYLLKESFLDIFSLDKERDVAQKEILDWIDTVLQTKLKKIKSFARSVLKRMDEILNWFDFNISNAKSEGLNNVIKTVLKRAYGYKNFDYFRMKVLQKSGYLMNYLKWDF